MSRTSKRPTVRTRLAGALAAACVGAGALFAADVAAAPVTSVAEAGECDLGGTLCGHIRNSTQSAYSLRVTGDWGDKVPNELVSAGREASYKDDDGWLLPA